MTGTDKAVPNTVSMQRTRRRLLGRGGTWARCRRLRSIIEQRASPFLPEDTLIRNESETALSSSF